MSEQKQQPANGANVIEKGEKELKRVCFQDLAQGATEVLVEHEGQVYRLRLTRNGKLILNK